MDFIKYDFTTRCRAIFVFSIGFLNPGKTTSLEEDFFLNLHDFANMTIQADKKRIIDFMLIIPSKRNGKQIQFYEDEKTVGDLYSIVDEIDSIYKYKALLESVEPKLVDVLSKLASEYIAYLNSFDNDYVPTLLPQ